MSLKKTVFSHPIHWIAFGFGAGLSPVAPGTMGSLVAVPLIWLMSFLSWPWYAGIMLIVIVLGTYVAGRSSDMLKVHDHSGIVIDEIAGMMLMMFFAPINIVTLAVGFACFRFFDIVKPWPIGWVDKQLKGGWGIMMDDLLAALYAAAVLNIICTLAYKLF